MRGISLNSNLPSLNAQRRLADGTSALRQGFERLASGLRINRASDDAAGMAVAAGLGVDRRVYAQGVRNINDGLGYLNIAEGATVELKGILLRLRELATQASNGTIGPGQRRSLDEEAQALVGEYNRIVAVTAFNGIEIFAEGNSELGVQAGYGPGGRLTAELAVSATVASGDGTFQPSDAYGVGASPNSVAVADFNGDGVPDLISADSSANTVSLLLGNGDGTFQARTPHAIGLAPLAVMVSDLNDDGATDVVTANGTGELSVLLGDGSGGFSGPPSSFATGALPRSVAAGDFNGDGAMDLVSADTAGSTLSVLLGNGDGTFQPRTAFGTGGGPTSVTVGDFNGDGAADLASADQGDGTVSVLLGNGDGTFQPRSSFAAGSTPQSVVVGDFNEDGAADFVSADFGSSTVSVLLGNGDGTFQPRTAFGTGGNPTSVAVGDFNGDGVIDLVSGNSTSGTVSVLLATAISSTTSISVRPLADIDVATRGTALASQATIDAYLEEVDAVAGIIGAAASRFEVAATTLALSSENYRAAESQILDADIAEEAAHLARSRILQQAGAVVLAQANQAPALALSLLQA